MRSFISRLFILSGLFIPALASAVTPMLDGGGNHTLALKSDGTVVAWGWNTNGQATGNGTWSSGIASPVVVPGLTGMMAVSGGYYDSVAVKSDGTVVAWGNNGHAQLGDGTVISPRLSPVQVKDVGGVGFLGGVVAVAAGTQFTVALKSDGSVVAWGYDVYGQVGDNYSCGGYCLTPVQVNGVGGIGNLNGVVAVAAGVAHAVALKSDGTVVAWGYNGSGQLGDGTTTNRFTPVVVPGLTGVVAVAAGFHYSVALKSDGTVVAWGYNGNGQLGDGTTTNRPTPVAVPGLTGVIAVAAGGDHSVALKSDTTVVAWGNNDYGQLGDNQACGTTCLAPVAVPGQTGVVAVSAGQFHTLTLKADGSVMSWGNAESVGDGVGIADRHSPGSVVGVGGVGVLNLGALPVLSYSSEAGYGTAGVSPVTGDKNTAFTFKVVYTHSGNTAAASVAVCIDASPCSAMSVDATAAAALHDGNYTNGEQYVYTTTLAGGSHSYFFAASDGATAAGQPLLGTLGGPTVSYVDLTVSALGSPSEGGSVNIGAPVTINSTITNAGTAPTTSWLSIPVYYYLSTDQDITKSDTLLSGRFMSGLAAGGSSSTFTIVTIPMNLAPGNYYIGAIIDPAYNHAESNEANNTRATTGSINVVRNVDLTVSALSSSADSGNLNVGGSITIHDTVTNAGSSSTTAWSFTVRYYLSTDNVITTADMPLGDRYVNGFLPAGATSSGNTSLNLPSQLAPGTYYIGAIVDALNNQPENNEGNNSRAATTPFTVVRDVDLTVSALSSTPNDGGSITINDTVTNGGSTPSTTWDIAVRYYLSTDNVITTADMPLGDRYIHGFLEAGATSSGNTTLSLPSSLASGTYYIGAIVDVFGQQPEFNEANNSRATTTTFNVVHEVDLTVSALSSPAQGGYIYAGGPVTINSTVRNIGTSATTTWDFTVRYYLSTDNVITKADMPLGDHYINGYLPAGASSSGAATVMLPSPLAPGTYYIGAIVDVLSQQPETFETNNSRATGSAVYVHP